MMTFLRRPILSLPHLVAALFSVLYIALLSGTSYYTTGLQFMPPLIIIMGVHLGFVWHRRAELEALSLTVLGRSGATIALMIGVLVVLLILDPPTANAENQFLNALGGLAMVLFCLLILLLPLLPFVLLFYFGYRIIRHHRRKQREKKALDDVFDGGTLATAFLVLLAFSLEGLPRTYSFGNYNSVTTSLRVEAGNEALWQTMQTATAIDFPLPAILAAFPQPLNVPKDEGVALGNNRIITIGGREGVGDLHLQVTSRTDRAVTFTRQSDTTPFARWINWQSLSYEITPIDGTAEAHTLAITLDYERLLSPSWVFGPMMRVSSRLATGVLARDVKMRAEALIPSGL